MTVLALRWVKISLRLWNYCSDGIMRVVGNLQVPTGHSKDILLQAKGITGIESTQIRWFSRWSGGGGWSGRAYLSGGQESQTRGQGTVQLPPQWAPTEAARLEGQRPNKGLLSQQFTKEHRAYSSSDWKHSEAKGQRRKTLTLCSNLEVAEGDGVDEVGDEWEPE